MGKRAISIALATLMPVTAAAQTPPDAAALHAIEAKVPPQGWYPEGYYDVLIAAEADQAEIRRPTKELASDWGDGDGRKYDVVDCTTEGPDPAAVDPLTARYGSVASEVARLRSELSRLGLPEAAYAAPLAAFEKAKVEEAAKLTEAQVMGTEYAEDDAEASEQEDPYFTLAREVESNRQRLALKTPKVIAEGGCGAGEGGPVIVRTSPPGGEVLLVNAFAFKVCTRRLPDPWDRFKCKWTEIETGAQKQLSGRYVYQVKWPDGTVRKGTRDIVPNYEDEAVAAVVTFKKVGS
ncbi:hypothetical protein V6U71_14885 [Sphingopyxis sp. J-6]|uniref:hypothetical protein n=1 Tax=Sphingopyxis sp. J-6 TaxID=3122054 RepID=UPI003984357F